MITIELDVVSCFAAFVCGVLVGFILFLFLYMTVWFKDIRDGMKL